MNQPDSCDDVADRYPTGDSEGKVGDTFIAEKR